MRKRILVTGLASFWGGRLAQALEKDPTVDVIVGLDKDEPTLQFERTEFVRVDESYSMLARIVSAAQIDTIVHTFLVVDSTSVTPRQMNEINVIGTMNLFAAASAAGSTVRNVVVKSSTYVYGTAPEDPMFFTESMARSRTPRTRVEQTLGEVESYVRDFAEDNPHVTVSLLRFSNVLGPEISTPLSRALSLPLVPSVFGFDPRFQFVHEDDVMRATLFALEHELPGIFKVAGEGLLPWSAVAKICGKRTFSLPPVGAALVTAPLGRIGVKFPPELLGLLRYGRGVDNRRLTAKGFDYLYTSAGAVQAFVEALRLRRTVGVDESTYHYERDVEQFFRHSPAIVRDHD